VSTILNPTSRGSNPRADVLCGSHALHFRQAKLSFPKVHILVGVFSDQTIRQHGYDISIPEEERYELVRHCRWVDEVIPEAPWKLNDDFLHQNRIDFVAIEEGASVSPAYDKIRVIGYDDLKRLGRCFPPAVGSVDQQSQFLGKVIPTRRIMGVKPLLALRGRSTTNFVAHSTSRPSSLEYLKMGCLL